jgi:hypothetical protein
MSFASHGLNSRADRPAAIGMRSSTVMFGMMTDGPETLNQIFAALGATALKTQERSRPLPWFTAVA